MKSTKLYPDNLFLLEFLVEKVEVYPKALPVDLRYEKGGICLSLLFFDNGPLDICEEEFDPISGCPGPRNRPRNGKSCLFALEPKAANNAMKQFDINVIAYKILENRDDDCNRFRIGEASISIAKEFSEVVKKSWKDGIHNPTTETHVCNASIQGTIPNGGCCIGDINMFIRISCFGKNIVTQIQMNDEDNSVYFKDKDGKSLYKYVKKPGADRKDKLDEICSPMPCTSYGLQSYPCPAKPCKIPPSCFPECQPPGLPCSSPCGTLPCNTPNRPCGFPTKFNICGPSATCDPLCGLPVGSKVCYLNSCAPTCFPTCFPCPTKKPAKGAKKGSKKGKKKKKK